MENQILDYLNAIGGGFPMKINVGGKPLKKKDGSFQIIPFKNKYTPIGISDILYLRDGKLYAFEVKTNDEKKWILKNSVKLSMGPTFLNNSKYKRYSNQLLFILRVIKYGGYGGFVDSIEDVESILKYGNNKVYTDLLEVVLT